MAVRCNGSSGNYLSRSANILDHRAAYTLMYWFNHNGTSAWQSAHGIGIASGTDCYNVVESDAGGWANLHLLCYNGTFFGDEFVAAEAAGVWQCIAVVRNSATSAYIHKIKLDGSITSSDEVTTDMTGSAAPDVMQIGDWTRWGEPTNAKYAYIKAWTRALSTSELQAQAFVIRVLNPTNLYGQWPTWPGTGVRNHDYSVNGYDWTENGTLTDEDPPPIAYGANVIVLPYVAEAVTTTTTTSTTSTTSTTTTTSSTTSTTTTTTLYSLSFAGTLATNGTIQKTVIKPSIAGSLATAGSLLKCSLKVLVGNLVSTGILNHITLKPNIAGTLTTSGTITHIAAHSFAGGLATTGALSKGIAKSMAGDLVIEGGIVKFVGKPLAGTLATSGTLRKALDKLWAGTLTSTGGLNKVVIKPDFAGTLATSGVLTTIKVKLLSFAGTLATNGTLSKTVRHGFAGTLVTSGGIVKLVGHSLTGTLTTSGVLRKTVRKFFQGVLDSAGTLLTAVIPYVPPIPPTPTPTPTGDQTRNIWLRPINEIIAPISGPKDCSDNVWLED